MQGTTNLFLFLFEKLVGATDVDFTQIPTFLSESLGISVFAAGLLATGVMMLLPIITLAILTKGKGFISELAVTIVFMSLGIALGWLPIWIFAIVIMLIAFLFAKTMGEKIGG